MSIDDSDVENTHWNPNQKQPDEPEEPEEPEEVVGMSMEDRFDESQFDIYDEDEENQEKGLEDQEVLREDFGKKTSQDLMEQDEEQNDLVNTLNSQGLYGAKL